MLKKFLNNVKNLHYLELVVKFGEKHIAQYTFVKSIHVENMYLICSLLSKPPHEFPNSRIYILFFLFFRGESYGVGHNHWFLFVIVTSFIITLLWCFFYLLQLREAISMNLPFSWLKLVRNFWFYYEDYLSKYFLGEFWKKKLKIIQASF